MKTPIREQKRSDSGGKNQCDPISNVLFYNNLIFYNNDNGISIITCELKYFKEPTQNFQFSYIAKEGC